VQEDHAEYGADDRFEVEKYPACDAGTRSIPRSTDRS